MRRCEAFGVAKSHFGALDVHYELDNRDSATAGREMKGGIALSVWGYLQAALLSKVLKD
jgi:hypothetical protein